MKAVKILHQKMVLKHKDSKRLAIFEITAWSLVKDKDYPEGVKYNAWFSENGETVFGFDNHKPKGPHLHIGKKEIGYIYRGLEALKQDIVAMIKKENFIYEDE